MARKLIGQSMIEQDLIDQQQLDELLAFQSNMDEKAPLGRLTVEFGLVTEEQFARFLAFYFGVPYVNLERYLFIGKKKIIQIVPESIAKKYNVLPLIKDDDTLTVATSDPVDLVTLENLKIITRCNIKPVVSAPSQIKDAIAVMYSSTTTVTFSTPRKTSK